MIKDGTNHPSHQLKVLRRRGADAWTEARPVLETLLAIHQVSALIDLLYDYFCFPQPRFPDCDSPLHNRGLLLWRHRRL